MRRAALTTFVLAAVLRATAQVADPAQAAAIVAQLEDAPTSAARFNLLNGRDFVFDFNAGIGVAKGAGGNITVANIADFPYLIGKGMSLTVGRMAPCGLSTPHYHPRATEFLYMLSGSNLKVGFLQENGARLITNLLKPGEGTIFPKGSFHYQANLDCQPISFVAGLNSEDPGAATVAQRFFGIPPDVVEVTLGDIGVTEAVRIAKSIPDTFAIGVQSCLDKCKIQRGDQPKDQQQPRVEGNQFPAGGQQSPSNSNNGGGFGNDKHQPPSDDDSGNDWDDDDDGDDDGDEGGYYDDDNDDDDDDQDDSDWGDSGMKNSDHGGGSPDVKKKPDQKSDNSKSGPDQKNGNDRNSNVKSNQKNGPDGKSGKDDNSKPMPDPKKSNQAGPDGGSGGGDKSKPMPDPKKNNKVGPDGKGGKDDNTKQGPDPKKNNKAGPDGGSDGNSNVKSNQKNGDNRYGPDGKSGKDDNTKQRPDPKKNNQVGPDGGSGGDDKSKQRPDPKKNNKVGPDGGKDDHGNPNVKSNQKNGDNRYGPDGKSGKDDNSKPMPDPKKNNQVGPDGKSGKDDNTKQRPDPKKSNQVGPDGGSGDDDKTKQRPDPKKNNKVGPDGGKDGDGNPNVKSNKKDDNRVGPNGKKGDTRVKSGNHGGGGKYDNVRSGAPRGSSITSPYRASRYAFRKRSNVDEDYTTFTSAISSLISSADAETIEDLVFLLKLVLGVLLSGYVFIFAYFVAPAWRNRGRPKVELDARTVIPPSVPVQDAKL